MADIRIRIRIRFRAFLKTEKKQQKKADKQPQDWGKTKKKKERNPMSVCGFWSIGCSYTPESQDCGPFYLLCPSRFFYGPLQDIMGFVVQLSPGLVSSGHIISPWF